MRNLLIVLFVVLPAMGQSLPDPSATERDVLEFVLTTQVSLSLIDSWALNPEKDSIVLPDQTSDVVFPETKDESEGVQEYIRKFLSTGEVDDTLLDAREINPHEDLVTSEGGVIPRELVSCGIYVSDSPVSLRGLRLKSVLAIRPAEAKLVDSLFRQDQEPGFSQVFPSAKGVVRISRPCITADGLLAGMSVEAYTTGIGGFSEYYLLRRAGSGWRVESSYVSFIE